MIKDDNDRIGDLKKEKKVSKKSCFLKMGWAIYVEKINVESKTMINLDKILIFKANFAFNVDEKWTWVWMGYDMLVWVR